MKKIIEIKRGQPVPSEAKWLYCHKELGESSKKEYRQGKDVPTPLKTWWIDVFEIQDTCEELTSKKGADE